MKPRSGEAGLVKPPNGGPDVGQTEAEVGEAVMGYLAEHPQTMDTLEGIAEWWVMRETIRVDLKTLAKLLRRLAQQGSLEEIRSGENKRYRLKTTESG